MPGFCTQAFGLPSPLLSRRADPRPPPLALHSPVGLGVFIFVSSALYPWLPELGGTRKPREATSLSQLGIWPKTEALNLAAHLNHLRELLNILVPRSYFNQLLSEYLLGWWNPDITIFKNFPGDSNCSLWIGGTLAL